MMENGNREISGKDGRNVIGSRTMRVGNHEYLVEEIKGKHSKYLLIKRIKEVKNPITNIFNFSAILHNGK